MRALQVIRSAYRCTVEEQDDPCLWIARAMKGAGAELAVLLRGNAVAYAVEGQDAAGLSFGSRVQTRPPCLDRDVAALVGGGTAVYVVEEDAGERGIDSRALAPGVKSVARAALPKLFAEFDQVWHW
jgi:sulfur relay (sulfurtransferase) DsrF/TusC family protein